MGRIVCTAPAGLGLAGWAMSGLAGSWAGMAVLVAAAELACCAAALAAVPPGRALTALVPRERRASYRWHQRQAYKARFGTDMPRPAAGRVPAGSRLEKMTIAAYRGRCAGCYARNPVTLAHPQIDHILSWGGGGVTWIFNLGVLCERCNQIKSNWNVSRDGYVHYRPFAGRGRHDPEEAQRITLALRRARRSPQVWWRAAWAMRAPARSDARCARLAQHAGSRARQRPGTLT